MKKISLVFILFLCVESIFALDEERSGGLTSAKMKMQTALQQIQNKQPEQGIAQFGDLTYKTLSSIKANLTSEYFSKTLMTDYTKSKTMEMLAQLAITSAFSIGTAAQGEQTTLVGNISDSLQATSDPQYIEIGDMFETLAAEMKTGNEIEAKQIAEKIQNYEETNSPQIAEGYKPTKEENSLLAGLGSVLSSSLGRILGMLSSFGMAMLFKALGFGMLASNPIGLAIAIIMQETLGAVFTGVTGGGDVNWTPVESAVVNQTTGIAEQGANAVEDKVQTSIDEAAGPNTDTVAVDGKTESGGDSSSPGTK